MIDKAIQTYISVLKAEVQHLKTKIEPHDTGHIHTTIGTLTHRIKELEEQQMIKYIHLLIGATLIAGGIGTLNMEFTFYICGVIFIAAGMGGILLGDE